MTFRLPRGLEGSSHIFSGEGRCFPRTAGEVLRRRASELKPLASASEDGERRKRNTRLPWAATRRMENWESFSVVVPGGKTGPRTGAMAEGFSP